MIRKRANKRKDKKYFSRTADKVHKKNSLSGVTVMRGGYRL